MTPNNLLGYLAAQAGAIAGMGVAGWITDPTSTDYQMVVSISAAFAEAFDTAWNSSAPLNILQQQAITAVVQQQFASRAPGPLGNLVFQLPSTWSVAALACAALVEQTNTFTGNLGITPPFAAQSPNYVFSVNSADLTAADPLVFSASAITRKGSGIFYVAGTSCPIPTGEPVEMTYTLLMDGAALPVTTPPLQKSSPVGPGDDAPCHQDAVVVIADFNSHVFATSATPASGTLIDKAGHCTVIAKEW
jgi:hypothetical protein